GDPDHLLTRPYCRIVKLQRKVVVGRVETAAGALWVKRYAVFAWRVALASLCRTSPAFGAWAGARALAAHGFVTPEPIAAIEFRRAGLLRRSFFVTREVAGAVTADVRWRSILADPDARRRRAARRALACALGDLFRRLHAAGLYHNDLKDVNVLTDGPAAAPRLVLLDLERVRALGRVGRRRRVKNLVQLARTLGRQASATDRVRFLAAYLGGTSTRPERRAWTAAGEIRAVLAHVPARVAGFAIPRLVCYLGRWWYRGDWYPRRVVRLVRRAATRWGGTDPHERAEVRGRVVPLHRPILHHSYADISDHLRSLNKLTAVAAEQPRLPRRVGAWRLIGEPAWRFVRAYLVRGGVRDGFPGLFVAATGAF